MHTLTHLPDSCISKHHLHLQIGPLESHSDVVKLDIPVQKVQSVTLEVLGIPVQLGLLAQLGIQEFKEQLDIRDSLDSLAQLGLLDLREFKVQLGLREPLGTLDILERLVQLDLKEFKEQLVSLDSLDSLDLKEFKEQQGLQDSLDLQAQPLQMLLPEPSV